MKALFTRKTRTTAERSEISERSSEKSKGRLSLGRSLKKLRLSIEDGASKKALEKKRSATTPTRSSPQLTESTTTSCSSDVGAARFVVNSKAPLGSGSYGQVLPAVDQITGEHVAVKCIADGRMRPEALEREVAILRRLSAQGGHPNVVGFVDYTRTQVGADGWRTLPPKVQGGHFLVMEAATGGELFDRVVATGGLPEVVAAPLIAQVLCALQHAHTLGVAHRDLKLENVLLAAPWDAAAVAVGEVPLVKLIDWGLAHQHALRADGSVVGEVLRSRCGSRSYMAPEVASRGATNRDGKEGYNGFKADVWSLGVSLFAMLHGFFPFEHADPSQDWRARHAMAAQRRGESTVAKIFSFYPDKKCRLSRPLHALLDKMLKFEPSERIDLAAVARSPWLAPHLAPLDDIMADAEAEQSREASVSSGSSGFASPRTLPAVSVDGAEVPPGYRRPPATPPSATSRRRRASTRASTTCRWAASRRRPRRRWRRRARASSARTRSRRRRRRSRRRSPRRSRSRPSARCRRGCRRRRRRPRSFPRRAGPPRRSARGRASC